MRPAPGRKDSSKDGARGVPSRGWIQRLICIVIFDQVRSIVKQKRSRIGGTRIAISDGAQMHPTRNEGSGAARGNIKDIKEPTFTTETRRDVDCIVISMSGNADSVVGDRLKSFLDELHTAATTHRIKE